MMKSNSSKLQTLERIRYVQECLLNDYGTREILIAVTQKYGVVERQAYRYLWAANRSFEEQGRKTIEKKVSYYIARKRRLIRDMDANEKKTPAGVVAINKVLDSMAKLEGVSVDTIKLIGDSQQPIRSVSEVKTSQDPLDYSEIPTEFLEMVVKNRRSA